MNLEPALSFAQDRVNFVSLLAVGEGKKSPNLKGDPLDLYVLNAVALHRSLERFGYSLSVFTNRPDLISAALERLGCTHLPVLTFLEFQVEPPADIGFRLAHHKLDLWRHLSECAGYYFVVLDLDVLCLRRPIKTEAAAFKYDGLRFDITEQVAPSEGLTAMAASIGRLTGVTATHRWFGGEFLGGASSTFDRLSTEVASLLPTYFDIYAELVHQGDEMLLAAAFQTLPQDRWNDVGQSEVIARHWTARTDHTQRSYVSSLRSEFVHLPASKTFLGFLGGQRFIPGRLVTAVVWTYCAAWSILLRFVGWGATARRRWGKT